MSWHDDKRQAREIRKDSVGSFMETRARNNTCIYCEAPLWKKENQSGDAWMCKGCYKQSVDAELAEQKKEEFKDCVKRDSNLIHSINKLRIKIDLEPVEFADYAEMEQYAVPVERVYDDDLPF